MQGTFNSIGAGAASAGATFFASTYALGYANAWVMPAWAPLALWEWVVVLGVGATLVALALHFLFLRVFGAKAAAGFASFIAMALLLVVVFGQLAHSAQTLMAWAVGAALASLVYSQLPSNYSLNR